MAKVTLQPPADKDQPIPAGARNEARIRVFGPPPSPPGPDPDGLPPEAYSRLADILIRAASRLAAR